MPELPGEPRSPPSPLSFVLRMPSSSSSVINMLFPEAWRLALRPWRKTWSAVCGDARSCTRQLAPRDYGSRQAATSWVILLPRINICLCLAWTGLSPSVPCRASRVKQHSSVPSKTRYKTKAQENALISVVFFSPLLTESFIHAPPARPRQGAVARAKSADAHRASTAEKLPPSDLGDAEVDPAAKVVEPVAHVLLVLVNRLKLVKAKASPAAPLSRLGFGHVEQLPPPQRLHARLADRG